MQVNDPPAHMGRIYYNVPLFLELTPNVKGDMEEVREYTFDEMKEFTQACRLEGFDERAVVAPRGETWKARTPMYWGVVDRLSTYKAHNEPYKPISVKWVDGKESRYWPEELFLIHRSLSVDDINRIVESQK